MSRLALSSMALSACLLTACAAAPVADVAPIDGAISGQCHTDTVRGAVGLAASAATVQRARVDSDSTEVQVLRGSERRQGGANAPIEATAGGPRLSVQTGRNNAITGMTCG